MTAAFNLSQLANNLNSSGQLDATDGLVGSIPVANGGTGRSSVTANNVVLGNGTSALQVVAPSTNENVLTSDGSTWISKALSTFSSFSKVQGATGYQKFPGGFTVQFGLLNGIPPNTNVTVTLPIPFQADFMYANIAVQDYTGGNEEAVIPFVIITNLATFELRNTDGDTGIGNYRWIAIGY
jgi:hypothetical protein